MELLADCLPCLLRQALEAARKASPDPAVHDDVTRQAAALLAHSELYPSAPSLCRDIHQLVRQRCDDPDPYLQDKRGEMALAASLLPGLMARAEQVPDPLEFALHVAAAGNIIDAGVQGKLVPETFGAELEMPFLRCCIDEFRRDLAQARTIVYIGDNSGEAVFDTVLLRQFAGQTVYYAVRSAPVLNDVTLQEAQAAGIPRYAQVVSSGCAAPGCLLDCCSPEFLRLFYSADLVIAKGQGNYESLSGCDRQVYFLLKAKCPVLARHLDVPAQNYVFTRSLNV